MVTQKLDQPVPPFPAHVDNYVVTAETTAVVPAGAERVIITANAGIWLAAVAAAVPTSDVVGGAGSVFLSAGTKRTFSVNPGQELSVVADGGTALVSFEYYLGGA